jgi:hypothetical protein
MIVSTRNILVLVGGIFLCLALIRCVQNKGRLDGSVRTWLLIALIFGAVSTWLWISGTGG